MAAGVEIGTGYISIVPSAKGFSSKLSAELGGQMQAPSEKAGKESGGFFSRAMETATGFAVAKGGMAVGKLFGSAVSKGFGRLESIDTAKGKLRGLGHDAASVDAIMASALASVKGTAFGLGDAATVAATTVAAGVKPGKDLQRTLTLVGDAATIGGASMGEMGAIFNKVAASNKIQMGEMNQLMDRGIPIQQYLAEHLGVSVEQVQKLASAGKISFADFQAAMEKGLGGAALESGKTFRGALENVGNAIGRLGAELMGPVFQMLPDFFAGVIDKADKLAPMFKNVGEGIAGVIGLLSTGDFKGGIFGLEEDSAFVDFLFNVRDAAMQVGPIFRDVIVPALRRLWETVAPLGEVFGILYRVLAPLAADLAKMAIGAVVVAWSALQKTLEVIVPIIVAVAEWMGRNETLVRALAFAVLSGVAAWKAYTVISTVITFLKTWVTVSKAAAGAQWLLNTAMKANPIGLVVTALGALVGGLIYAYQNSETFRNVVNGAFTVIRNVVGAVVDWFANTVAPFFVGLWEKLIGGASQAETGLTGVWDRIRGIFQAGLNFIVELFLKWHPLGIIISHWGEISAYFIGVWEHIKGIFTTALNAVIEVVRPWGQWFLSVFGEIFKMVQVLVEVPLRLAWMGVQAIWEGIKTTFTAAAVVVRDVILPGVWAVIEFLVINPLRNAWAGLQLVWTYIQAAFAAAATWVGTVFRAAWNLLQEYVIAPLRAAWQGITAVWTWIMGVFTLAWNWVTNTFMAWWRTLTGLIGAVMTAVANFIRQSWDNVMAMFTLAWNWVNTTFRGWWGLLTELLAGPIRRGREVLDGILGAVRGAFESAVNFIRDQWGRLDAIIKAPIRLAIEAVKALARVFRDVGKMVGIADDKLPNPDNINLPPGFQSGGVIPGVFNPSARDNVLLVSGAGRAIARGEPGEAIIPREATRRNWPLISSLISKGAPPTGPDGLPGFFLGGVLPTPGPVRPHRMPYYNARYAADMGYGTGSPIYAWAPGTVSQVMFANTSYGNRVRINHANGQTLYAHMSRIAVTPGQRVAAGQQIGAIGYSGNVRPAGPGGAHLHFEILGGAGAIMNQIGSAAVDTFQGFDPLGKLQDAIAGPFAKLQELGDSPLAQMVKNIPNRLKDAVVEKLTELAGKFMGANDGSMSGPVGAGANAMATALMRAGKTLGASRQAMKIALMTAFQESSMGQNRTAMTRINRDGDVGIFQQRATRGDGGLPLGSPAAIARLADPLYGLRVFLQGVRVPAGYHVPGLYNIRGWEGMRPGNAAQRVQVSAHPTLYHQHEGKAEALLRGFGYASGTLSARPGLAWVGERGPELVDFRGGERVWSHQESVRKAGGDRPINVYALDPLAAAQRVNDELRWGRR